MSLLANRAVSALLACGAGMMLNTYIVGQQRAPLTITRLYTGSDGQTHEDTVAIQLTPSTIYRSAEASQAVKVTEAQFFRLPKGKVQDWHNPAHRQYVVTLAGRGEVEIAGRQKILLNPGRVVLLENVTGRGHITRSVGTEDLTFFIVPLADR